MVAYGTPSQRPTATSGLGATFGPSIAQHCHLESAPSFCCGLWVQPKVMPIASMGKKCIFTYIRWIFMVNVYR